MQHSRCHKGCHRGPDATIEFDRSLLGGLIVVGGEAQFKLASLQVFVFVLVGVDEGVDLGIVSHHLGNGTHEFPSVVQVKSCREVVGVGTLGKHDQVTGFGFFAQGLDALVPEFGRHLVGDVAAETVNAHAVYPEAHGVDHGCPHILVVVVEVCHIGPIGARRIDDVTYRVVGVPVGMLLQPHVIPRGVIGYPIKDDTHAAFMTGLDQHAQVIDGTILRCHRLVVAYGIGRVLAFYFADGVDGHDPQHVNTQILNGIEASQDGLE